jgi:hypothetical protein
MMNPGPKEGGYILLLEFYCDESYDGTTDSKVFVVGGFLAKKESWGRIAEPWQARNNAEGVKRFHAAEVNGLHGEFSEARGWNKGRIDEYVKFLLGLIKSEGQEMLAVSCAILAHDYKRIISVDGQKKVGDPYTACFNTLVNDVAESMREFPEGDQFSIFLDRSDYENNAVNAFLKMKDDQKWDLSHRLATCTAGGNSCNTIPLQVADLIAYDTYKMIQDRHFGAAKVRKSLESLFSANRFTGHYFDAEVLSSLKDQIESAPGTEVVIFHDESFVAGGSSRSDYLSAK